MTIPEFLSGEATAEIRLTGHRIGLYHIVHDYCDGYSPEMLACQYPTLPLALIHKTIAFYLENQAEIDAYVAAYQGELAKQSANAKSLDVAALRRRLDAKNHAKGA
jgi:uncharacterized protein (DUF433 family)